MKSDTYTPMVIYLERGKGVLGLSRVTKGIDGCGIDNGEGSCQFLTACYIVETEVRNTGVRHQLLLRSSCPCLDRGLFSGGGGMR